MFSSFWHVTVPGHAVDAQREKLWSECLGSGFMTSLTRVASATTRELPKLYEL